MVNFLNPRTLSPTTHSTSLKRQLVQGAPLVIRSHLTLRPRQTVQTRGDRVFFRDRPNIIKFFVDSVSDIFVVSYSPGNDPILIVSRYLNDDYCGEPDFMARQRLFLRMIGVSLPSTHQRPVYKLRIGLAVMRSSILFPGIPLSQSIGVPSTTFLTGE